MTEDWNETTAVEARFWALVKDYDKGCGETEDAPTSDYVGVTTRTTVTVVPYGSPAHRKSMFPAIGQLTLAVGPLGNYGDFHVEMSNVIYLSDVLPVTVTLVVNPEDRVGPVALVSGRLVGTQEAEGTGEELVFADGYVCNIFDVVGIRFHE